MQGHKPTAPELIEQHQARLYGYMRCRVRADANAKDLVQDTWVEVWRRIGTFDAERGSFWAFTRVWAEIVLRRHWARRERLDTDASAAATSDDETVDPGAESHSSMPIPVPDWPLAEGMGTSPESSVDAARVLAALLARVAGCDRPPHEVIVFGFSRLHWKPNEIARDLGGAPLAALQAQLEDEYVAASRLQSIRELWQPLRAKLARTLAECIDDPRTRKMYPALLSRVAGETRLQEYFAADKPAEESVTRWWDAVKRAVFNDIQSGGSRQLLEWLESFVPAAGRRGRAVGGRASVAAEAGR